MVCSANFYALPGDFCLPCPQGATCAGYVNQQYTLPVPASGWYNLNGTLQLNANATLFALCPDARGLTNRLDLTCIVPCEPAEACAGANYCGEGYTDTSPAYRCSTCALGFYRLSGSCAVCPSSAWVLIVVFLVIAVAICIGGWLLNRRNVNIAFLSIGVDYFQVLAMFSNASVKVRLWQKQVLWLGWRKRAESSGKEKGMQ